MAQNKKTVAELKNELYITTLIEKHQKDNVWLTRTFKEKYEKIVAEYLKNAQQFSISQEKALSCVENDFAPYYKEYDVLLYLLLTFSMSHLDISKLTENEMCHAKDLLISDFEHDMDKTCHAISEIISYLKEWYRTPNINHAFIVKSLELDCNNGLNCFEPYSHFFDYSETLAYSMEELVIYKCLQSCTISCISKEKLHDLFSMGWSSSDYPGMTEEEVEEIVEEKVQSKIANFVNNPRIKLVPESDNSGNWQFDCEKEYSSILLPLDFFFAYAETMNIDFFMNHVCDGGRIILYGCPDEEDNSSSDSSYRKKIERIAHRIDFATYFAKQKLGGGVEIYVFIKGKTSSTVDVFYPYDSNIFSKMDITHEGMFNHVALTSEDLIAINYDMSKLEWIPSPHVSADERYLALQDFLEASKDEYVRLKHTAFGKVFSPDNFASSFDTFVVNPSSLRETQVDEKWKKVSEPVLVIRQNPFAVAYVEASADQPVYFKEMTMTFSVKENVVDPKYLYLLSTNGKLEQVVKNCPEEYFLFDDYTLYTDERSVSYVGFWPAKSLLCHKELISIPNKEEQLQLVSDSVINQMHENLKSSFENFKKEIHRRKHALTPVVSDIQKRWNVLQKYIKKNGGVIRLDDSIGIENPIPVSVWNNQISHDLEILTNRTKRLADEPAEIGAEYGTACSFSMQDFITQYVESHRPDGYDILVDDSIGKCSNLFFSKSGLERIFDNIIRNAISHGFEPSRNNIVLLKACQNDDYVVLSVCNNGLPISKGLTEDDILSWGRSTNLGENGHEGIGGNEIKNIIKFYGGKVIILSTPQDEYTVEYQLHIPQSYE